MKKRIIFCCYGLGIGGIEKCMINLLNTLDTTKYDIDVLPMNPEYTLVDSLKANITLLDPFDYVMNTTDTVEALRKSGKGFLSYFKYILFRIVNKWGKKPWKLFASPIKEYDIAIAYAHTAYVPYYVIDCIKAKKKYMWHHEGRYIKDSRYVLDQEYFPKFDAIIPVSEDDKQILIDVFPNLKDRFHVLYNVLDREEICLKAEQNVGYLKDSNVLKLTTVGRLTDQKGPDILLEIAEKLRDEGIIFVWYWIGAGDKMEWMHQEIEQKGLKENVILMGNQKNPYPYIAGCDIYVQPSRYEAYCTTTLEAQILQKPIVVTDVCGMREQFIPNEDGILTSVDAESIFRAILELYNNEDIKYRLCDTLQKKMNNTNDILADYYALFDRD